MRLISSICSREKRLVSLKSKPLTVPWCSYADRELSASTFAARVCASTLTDIYSCVTAAVGALKGSLHGGANECVFDMLKEIREEGDCQAYLDRKLASHEKIMGFGHRVYKTQDPREKYLRQMAKDLTQELRMRSGISFQRKLKPMKHAKHLIPNVDFIRLRFTMCWALTASIYTLIFAMSRVAGWIAHIQEQRKNNKLIRPRSNYIGAQGLEYLPIGRR